MLPHNRQLKKLGELCKIRTGKKDANYATEDGLYPFFTCGKEILKAPNYSFDTEAILIAGNGDVGACKYYKGKFEAYQRTYVVDGFDSSIDINYIFHVLNGRLKVHAIKESLGSAIPYIKLGTLQNFKIPLPPLEEQKKIVAYLDELNATITKLKNDYQAQLMALDEMRNSSLDLAFGGARERERAYNLNNWKWVKLGEVFEVKDGTHDSPKFQPNGYPLITSKNLNPNGLDLENIKYISKQDYDQINLRSKVDKGDLLFAMIGTIGNPTIIQDEPNFAIKNVALFKPMIGGGLIEYLKYNLLAKSTINKMLADSKGATQKFVGLGYLRNFKILFPSLEEQSQIVAHLDQVHSQISTLKSQVSAQITRCDELWQSSLEKVLKGGVTEIKEQG